MISQKSVPVLRLTFLTCQHCMGSPKPHNSHTMQLQGACVCGGKGRGTEVYPCLFWILWKQIIIFYKLL